MNSSQFDYLGNNAINLKYHFPVNDLWILVCGVDTVGREIFPILLIAWNYGAHIFRSSQPIVPIGFIVLKLIDGLHYSFSGSAYRWPTQEIAAEKMHAKNRECVHGSNSGICYEWTRAGIFNVIVDACSFTRLLFEWQSAITIGSFVSRPLCFSPFASVSGERENTCNTTQTPICMVFHVCANTLSADEGWMCDNKNAKENIQKCDSIAILFTQFLNAL